MKDLLLAIDTDEARAVAQAEAVLDLFEAEDVRAHLFHDFVDNPEGASVSQVPSVRRASEVLEDGGIDASYHEASGDPTESIIRMAKELDVDAIVVCTGTRSPAGKAVFGSVAQEVLLNAERPTIVLTP